MIDLVSAVLMSRKVTEGMSVRELRLLVLSSETTPGVTIRHAAESMKAPKPSITRGADALERLGLAKRFGDPLDLRSVLVKITKDGRKLLTDINRDIAKAQAAVAKRLATEAAKVPADIAA